MRIADVMKSLGLFELCTRPTITHMCAIGRIPAKQGEKGEWDIDPDYVTSAKRWREKVVSLTEILADISEYHRLSEKSASLVMRYALTATAEYRLTCDQYPMFRGVLFDRKDRLEVEKKISEIVHEKYVQATALTIDETCQRLQTSPYKIKVMIRDGVLDATMSKGKYYVSPESVEQQKIMASKYIGVFEVTQEMCTSIETTYNDSDSARRLLLSYLLQQPLSDLFISRADSNMHGDRRNSYYFPVTIRDQVEALIKPYLIRIGKAKKRIVLLESSEYWKTHPKTFEAVERFKAHKTDLGMAALMEILIQSMPKEIMEASDAEIDEARRYAESAAPDIYLYYFICFVNFVRQNYQPCAYTQRLIYTKKETIKPQDSVRPYSVEEYFGFAYMVFGKECINQEGLLEKALSDEKQAMLWLLSAWSYIGAWRTGDIYRLPIMKMRLDDDLVCDRIRDGTYDEEGEWVSLQLETRINTSQMLPHKTKDRQTQHYLTVCIPESLRAIIGTIYTICVVHCHRMRKPSFTIFKYHYNDYVAFFGKGYTKLFNKPFSNRRATKTFLNVIVETVERGQKSKDKVVGYMVASYARAHSSAPNHLSQVTSVYLATKLDGLTVDEIVYQMFERGSCSFVVYMLLSILYGDAFQTLPAEYQTKVMAFSHITAVEAEETAVIVRRAYSKAEKVVASMFAGHWRAKDKTEFVRQVLENIISNRAVSRMVGVDCLCAAARFPCAYPKRKNCVSCDYGLVRRAVFFIGLKQIDERYIAFRNAKSDAERRMQEYLLQKEEIPCMITLLQVAKNVYGMDIAPYKERLMQIMEGEKNGIGTNGKPASGKDNTIITPGSGTH